MGNRYDQIMRRFATRLKAARESAGFTSAQQFADWAGLNPHAYRKYERVPDKASTTPQPKFDALVRICEMLKISVSDLLPTETEIREAGNGACEARKVSEAVIDQPNLIEQ
jgi:transcriptional regulator with XRE-family HTH domain